MIFQKFMNNHFCIQKPYLHTKNNIDCPTIDYFIGKKALATKFLIQTVVFIIWLLVYDLQIFIFIKYTEINPIVDSNLIEQKFMPAILLEIFTCSLLDSTTEKSTKNVS